MSLSLSAKRNSYLTGASLAVLALFSGPALAQGCFPVSCTASGAYTASIGAADGTTLNVDAGTSVLTTVDVGAAVFSGSTDPNHVSGNVNLNGTSGSWISLETTADYSNGGWNRGIVASGVWAGGMATPGSVVGQYVNVTTRGVMADGVYAEYGGQISLIHANVDIYGTGTAGIHGNGLAVYNSNGQTGTDLLVSSISARDTHIRTFGTFSNGLYVQDTGTIEFRNGTIETGIDEGADGHSAGAMIQAPYNGPARAWGIISGSTILTHGYGNPGVYVTSGDSVNFGALGQLSNTQITTEGPLSHGLQAEGGVAGIVGNNVNITIKGGGEAFAYMNSSHAALATKGATIDLAGGTITIDAAANGATGPMLGGSNLALTQRSTMILTDYTITSHAASGHALVNTEGALLTVIDSTVTADGGGWNFYHPEAAAGLYLSSASAPHIADGSGNPANWATTSVLDNVQMTSALGAGVLTVGGLHNATFLNGSVVTGVQAASVDVFRDMDGQHPDRPGTLNLTMDASTLNGLTLVSGSDGTTAVDSTKISALNLTLQNGSVWNMTGNSALTHLNMDNGTVNFAVPTATTPTQADFHTLTVGVGGGTQNYTYGSGMAASMVTGVPGLDGIGPSRFNMNTLLNAGGALANQATDRLIVNGNVTGQHIVAVNGFGTGAVTGTGDVALNNEGISLIQVAGTSAENSFAVASPGGIVAVGGFQYKLYAYGPASSRGAADASQNLTTNTAGTQWDYRLQTPDVVPPAPPPPPPPEPGCETTNTCPPPAPPPPAPPGPGPQPETRAPVVPQAPTFINLPTAMMNAGFQDIDMLHRRLGELHDDNPNALNRAAGERTDGEAFLRIYGGQFDYSSNNAFSNYGYDFDQNYTAVQVGANVFSHRNENAITRVGFAFTYGDMSMTTNSPDIREGRSRADVNTYSLQGYVTRQWNSGFYIDGVMSFGLFDGTVKERLYGGASDVSGNSFAVGLEIGRPWHFAENWTLEPQAQLVYQRLSFSNSTDEYGEDVHWGSPQQLIGRVGARLTRAFRTDDNQMITPYAKLNLIHGFFDGSDVTIGTNTFATGDYGTALQAGAGMTGTLNQRWSVYGDAAYQWSLNNGGFGGWVANAGVRYVW